MPTLSRRQSRASGASCVAGSESGVDYTLHHFRCTQDGSISGSERSPKRRKSNISTTTRTWPGATSKDGDQEQVSCVNVRTTIKPRRCTPGVSSTTSSIPARNTFEDACSSVGITHPSRCKVSNTFRSNLLFYITITVLFFLTTTTATPLPRAHTPRHIQIHVRQAIPDKSGETGNEPAPVASLALPSSSTTAITISITPPTSIAISPTLPSTTASVSVSPSTTTSVSPSPTTPAPDSSGNTNPNPPENLGENPNSSPSPLALTSPQFSFSAGVIAGLVGGGLFLICIIIGVSVLIYRKRHLPDITEIPIRRSKLGSRLGFRVFGERVPSRSRSRQDRDEDGDAAGHGINHYARKDSAREDYEKGEAWLDKSSIGKLQAVWLENGYLSVPKPGFLRAERLRGDEEGRAPWVDKGWISGPRPGRPVSAEPLGRLSGMGMGMGYLK